VSICERLLLMARADFFKHGWFQCQLKVMATYMNAKGIGQELQDAKTDVQTVDVNLSFDGIWHEFRTSSWIGQQSVSDLFQHIFIENTLFGLGGDQHHFLGSTQLNSTPPEK
jgi:hypothetical protein